MQAERAIDRPLRNGVAPQDAIFSVAPGALGVVKLFIARGPIINALVIAHLAAHQKVHQPLIGHQRVDFGAIIDGIAALRLPQVPIIMQEHTHIARMAGLVLDLDAPQQHVAIDIDGIMADKGQFELIVGQRHLRDQGIFLIQHLAMPGAVVNPKEAALDPDAHAADIAERVVFFANMRPVYIAEIIAMVKIDQHRSRSSGKSRGIASLLIR